MRKIVWAFCALALSTWALNLAVNPPAMTGRGIVHEVFYFNGILAWGFMAMAIVIAARPAWLESATKTPLDELYRWHRTLGIWAVVLAVVHFFTKALMQPVLALMTLEPTPRIAPDPNIAGFEAFWQWLRGFAVTSSEWATAAAVILFAISFVSVVRYHKWLSTHKLFSILFLVLSVHCIRLMDSADILTPFGMLNIAVTVVGCWYSIVLLVHGAGQEKSTTGRIVRVTQKEGMTLVYIKPDRRMQMQPGQFAFLRTPGHEKHPFSVAGVENDGSLVFVVKALGDYTAQQVPNLQPGEAVIVEGPWGAFTPNYALEQQLWLAGGAGIAPFCAWLEDATKRVHGAIRLVWCIKSKEDEPLHEKVAQLAKAAGVVLEIYESKKKRLNAAELFDSTLPQTVALCAGSALAQAVSAAYINAGGSLKSIRREHFEWR